MDKPFLHLFLITRIKRNTKSKIVDKKFLKEELARIIVRKGGLPKFMVKYVIDDLIKIDLIKREKSNLYLLRDNPEEKRISSFMEFV